jgi:TonB family protein
MRQGAVLRTRSALLLIFLSAACVTRRPPPALPNPVAASPSLLYSTMPAPTAALRTSVVRTWGAKPDHRPWVPSTVERWRSAIENYVSSVKPGNQTALNTAAVPFASYLNGMHKRLHPLFADWFLASLGSLPDSDPLNEWHLVTRLEIILTEDGRIKQMGVVKASGITAFDIAALDAVDRAQPFGPAPDAIMSADRNVYMHWEFYRDEVRACSTMGSRPYLLRQ